MVRVCLNYVWNILRMTTEKTRTAPAAAAKRIQRQTIASAHVKRDFASAWNTIRRTLTPHRRARSAMCRHRWLVKIQWIWQHSVSSSIPALLIQYDFRFILRGRWVNSNSYTTTLFYYIIQFYSFMIDGRIFRWNETIHYSTSLPSYYQLRVFVHPFGFALAILRSQKSIIEQSKVNTNS